MSIRAYRVMHIEYDNPSFNCNENIKLMEFLLEEGNPRAGSFEIEVKKLQEALANKEELGIDDKTAKQIAKDIGNTVLADDETVLYHCF